MERLLGFDWQLINDAVITGISVFILFFALSYLLFNPVKAFLAKRQEMIENDLDTAKTSKESAQALKAEYEAKLREVDKEAEAILEEARKKAKKREAEIIDEAKTEAARIMERANHEILLEKKKALDDMKQEMISVASLMAGKVVAASMDTQIQDSLVEETLKEIGESTWQS